MAAAVEVSAAAVVEDFTAVAACAPVAVVHSTAAAVAACAPAVAFAGAAE